MRRCRRWKLGRPFSSSATTSPSRIASCVPSARPELAQLRVARRDVVAVAALQPQPAALGVADRAHAVPLDLVGPVVADRQLARAREHRLDLLRQRLAVRVLRRVHAVDHPVLAAGPEQDVLAAHALAVEGDHDLLVAPLVRPRRCRGRRSSSCPRRSGRPGSRRGSRGTRAGGPRSARRGCCASDRPGCPSGSPTRRACPRARGAGPSASRAPSAPARRSAARRPVRRPLSRRFRGRLEVAFGPIGVEAVGHPITNTR